jgi:hypothetical protein
MQTELSGSQAAVIARFPRNVQDRVNAHLAAGEGYEMALSKSWAEAAPAATPAAVMASLAPAPAAEPVAAALVTPWSKDPQGRYRSADGVLATPAQALDAARASRGLPPRAVAAATTAPTAAAPAAATGHAPTLLEQRQARVLSIQARKPSPQANAIALTLSAFQRGTPLAEAADRHGVLLANLPSGASAPEDRDDD